MKTIILNSLEKVFSDKAPEKFGCVNKPAGDCRISMLKNQRVSFQVAFSADNDTVVSCEIKGELSERASAYIVKEVPVGNACYDNADDFYLRKTSGDYPDVLVPVNDKIEVKGGIWNSLWIEITPDGVYSGTSELVVEIKETGNTVATESVTVDVIDAELPKQELVYTNWFHCDCLCNYYGVEPFSNEFWRICKNFVKTAVDHGMNCILTPLFTPPLDTRVGGERKTVQLVDVKKSGGTYYFNFKNLRKWFSMCRECGIEYFEMSHLFTQWGAKHAPKIVASDSKGREKKIFGWFTRTSSKKYDRFLRLFAAKLVEVIESEGLRENCYFHVSDEPSERHLKIYRKRAKLISEVFPGFKVIDALSEYEFYEKGAVKHPIPCEDKVEDFYGKVPELWTYYCCGQGDKYLPNRFLSMPSVRNRVLGFLLYKYDVKGFLHWGYNFYNSQYSIKAIDPYKITDAGGGFPSGDSFIVYPAKDGTALESLRLKVFYDGFQDM
ncbi:MAG: DUF4091 domain-containing protein, partial [Clostridia bacterium]|nr:DUF4091 domain-containing protein [Clostridia bacterium]